MKSFGYTYACIAEASGKSQNNVRVDINRGKLDPKDLSSVSVYITLGLLEKHAGRTTRDKHRAH